MDIDTVAILSVAGVATMAIALLILTRPFHAGRRSDGAADGGSAAWIGSGDSGGSCDSGGSSGGGCD